MEDFGQIFIILIFIAVTLLEGLGRKRKAGQKTGQRGRTAEPPAPAPPSPHEAAEPAPPPRAQAGGGADRSSEGLIPQDVWEEILGLARGAKREDTKPAPPPMEERRWGEDPALTRRRSQTLEEIPDFEARSLEPLTPRGEEAGTAAPSRSASTLPPVHRGPAGSTRRIAALPAIKSRAVGVGPEAADLAHAGRRTGGLRGELFGSGSPRELRKAVILREVLGPPLGLREGGRDPRG